MKIFASVCLFLFLGACSATLPVEYTPQTYLSVKPGKVSIGNFSYVPYEEGKVKANQIQNSAVGSIYIATEVANFVKRATALEFERAGITLDDDAPVRIDADIEKLRAGDLGYSVQWNYTIVYRFVEKKSGNVVFERSYSPPTVKTGKFGHASDYTPNVNELVLAGIEDLLRDMKGNNYLETPVGVGE